MKPALNALAAIILSALLAFSGGAVIAQASTSDSSGSATVARSPITDNAEMFSPAEEVTLTEAIVKNHEKYGLFFAIETITTLDGQQLEAVALAHANELGIGEASKDNGVFIFLSRDDRKIRFELGSGVSEVVTDSEMTSIIDSVVTPKFQTGNYHAGVEAGMLAVGEDYAGVSAAGDNEDWIGTTLLIAIGIPVLFFSVAFLYSLVGKEPRKKRKAEQARKDSLTRLKILSAFASSFKYSPEINRYKALPDEQGRLAFLQAEHPDIAATLEPHFASKIPTTIIIDRELYSSTNDFFTDYFGKPDSLVKVYKLWGTGFEGISINEANSRIEKEKEKYVKGLESARKKKARAKKIWEAIPEPTQKALKKAKTQGDRLALLADDVSSDFTANYALITSMFLSSGSSSNSSSSSSGSSSSSNSSSRSSSSSSSSYDSGSYGGGSFDGGGGSGSW